MHNAVNLLPQNPKLTGDARLAERNGLLGTSSSSQGRVLLSVGRFSREKAQADLIAAMQCLTRQHPELPIQLIILGEGPEEQAIKRAIGAAGLGERVRMPGHVREVQRYYDVADAVVIPSWSEGSPNVLLEAMAAGVPVVATSVGGIPEIVSDGESALLVAPRAPEEMARAIHKLLTTPPLAAALVDNARELVRTRHSPDSRAEALVQIYARVCDRVDEYSTAGR
jgi:glycosyltransferase involved in cell wall biosynthesis